MQVQTFVGKMSVEALQQMDDHVNKWLAEHEVQPKFVCQTYGQERHHEGGHEDSVLITSIWY